LRGEEPAEKDGNFLLDHLAGARIDCYPARVYTRDLESLFQTLQVHYAQQGHKALAIPTGGSDGIGVWGYIAACEELAADFAANGIAAAHIATASGSGGTQAGLTLGVEVYKLPATVWGINVCDDEQYFIDKVNADTQQCRSLYPQLPPVDIQPRVLDGYVGPGYGVAEAEVFELIAQLAAMEGLVLDPVYTGKAFRGMVSEIARGTFEGVEDIVFMHTGGTFGIFPQRGGFS